MVKKKKLNNLTKALVLSNLFFMLITFILYIQFNAQSQLLVEKEELFQSLQSEAALLDSFYHQALENLTYLQVDYNSLEVIAENQGDEILLLRSSVSNLTSEKQEIIDNFSNSINDLKNELLVFEESINETIDWLSTNSNLDLWFFDALKRDLSNNCAINSGGFCQIKTHCIYFVNSHYTFIHNFTYFSEPIDTLANLSYTYDIKRGGDCEDWSLFTKAEYNYLLSECRNRGFHDDNIKVVYYLPGTDDCYLTSSNNWYLPRCTEKSTNKLYSSVICFEYGDKKGHCELAFTDDYIANSSMVYDQLKDSVIIEPQGGYEDESLINIYNSTIVDIQPSFIIYAITDDDFYTFYYNQYTTWKGYKDLRFDAQKKLFELNELNESVQ